MEKNVYKNFEKVVVNSGLGKISQLPNFGDKVLPVIEKDFASITGQKPSERPATKSISGFKLRQGQVIGLKATLRHKRMEQFLEKVMKIVLPRVRDFRGLPQRNVDTHGSLNFGIKDASVFPELVQDATKVSFGVEITVVPKVSKDRVQMLEIYKGIGVPFSKEEIKKKK